MVIGETVVFAVLCLKLQVFKKQPEQFVFNDHLWVCQ